MPGHHQTDGRGHQCLGDAGHYHCGTATLMAREIGEGFDAFFAGRFNYRGMAQESHSCKMSIFVTTSIERSSVERTDYAVVANKTRKVHRVERTI